MSVSYFYYYNFCKDFNTELVKVHVSGHAYHDALKSLAHALKPKALIPVHTLSGDDFSNHFENVVRVDNGVTFNVYFFKRCIDVISIYRI